MITVAKLGEKRLERARADPLFSNNWDVVKDWSEHSRYRTQGQGLARDLLQEDWRFVLASRQLDAVRPSEAYGLVHDAFAAAGISLEKTPPLLILKMSDPFIRALRKVFSKAKSVEGIRLGGQLIGDRFVTDALVYRVR